VPVRALAGAVTALVALALMIVLAPALRRPPPRVVVSDARMDFQAAPGTIDGAEQLVVAPGTEHPAAEDGGEAPSTRPEDEPGIATTLADASSALQDWLEHTLGVDDHWESGEPMPASEQQHARRSAQDGVPNVRPPTGDGEAKDGDDARGADGEASRRADGDPPATQTPGGGGGGAGAGSDTDPSLYGEAHDGPGRAGDRFELAIAARVRTRRGAAMDRWTTAPDPEADRQPALAGHQRTEQPGHRMAIPASFAPLVRRLYGHATQGDAP